MCSVTSLNVKKRINLSCREEKPTHVATNWAAVTSAWFNYIIVVGEHFQQVVCWHEPPGRGTPQRMSAIKISLRRRSDFFGPTRRKDFHVALIRKVKDRFRRGVDPNSSGAKGSWVENKTKERKKEAKLNSEMNMWASCLLFQAWGNVKRLGSPHRPDQNKLLTTRRVISIFYLLLHLISAEDEITV